VLAELTEREREVVLLAAEGLSNREIGARLYLSEGTVRNYLSTAFGKLGVARRAQLAPLVAQAAG
jgi:RNA polymerase sigma factor (sigma-70 family)